MINRAKGQVTRVETLDERVKNRRTKGMIRQSCNANLAEEKGAQRTISMEMKRLKTRDK